MIRSIFGAVLLASLVLCTVFPMVSFASSGGIYGFMFWLATVACPGLLCFLAGRVTGASRG